jgi:hypothetical protein
MTARLAAARPGGELYRVGRAPDAWSWPPWAYAGEDGTFGNRYDDPAAGAPRARSSARATGARSPTSATRARWRTCALARRLVHYGLDDLDAGDLRQRAPHAFTREVSRYVFEHGLADDGERLLGIYYLSRLGDDIENWAIFAGSEPHDALSEDISRDDQDLVAALAMLDLTLAAQASESEAPAGRAPPSVRPR